MNVNTVVHNRNTQVFLGLVFVFFVGLLLVSGTTEAVTVETLQAPMRALKTQLFGGWMMAVKIIAAAIGIILSVVKMSFTPGGIGVGISVGIHFFDAWLGDGAAGALI